MWLETFQVRSTERPTKALSARRGRKRGLLRDAIGTPPLVNRYALVITAVLLGTFSSAWPQMLQAQAGNAIGTGAKVHPIAALPLRTSPPEGFLGTTGSVVAQTDPAHTYFVVGQKTIQTVAGQQMWLNVKDMTSNQLGWIYTGSGAQPFQNVTKATN